MHHFSRFGDQEQEAEEDSVRQQILDGLIADKGGDDQVSTATRILTEVIASDASWPLV